MSISSNAAKDAATVRVNDYVRLAVPADVVHDEVHPGAQLSLLRLAWSPDAARRAAGVHLIGAVRNGLVRRVTPSASVDTALLIDMDDDTYAIDFNRDLTWNVPMLDSALSSLVLAHIAELTNGSVKALEGQATESVNPWLGAAVCAGCSVAILDGVPGDEIPACLLCANVCSAGSGLAATEPDPVFLKAWQALTANRGEVMGERTGRIVFINSHDYVRDVTGTEVLGCLASLTTDEGTAVDVYTQSQRLQHTLEMAYSTSRTV